MKKILHVAIFSPLFILSVCAPGVFSQDGSDAGESEATGAALGEKSGKVPLLDRVRSERDRLLDKMLSERGKKILKFVDPKLSVVGDVQALFTDDHDNDNRGRFRIKSGEINFSAHLLPHVRGDFTGALEQGYEGSHLKTRVAVEEAYLTFHSLPLASEIQFGRKLMDFGRLNPVHPHHWAFADTPLVLEDFFGHHPWIDDGAQASVLVPNPLDLYAKATFGFWKGKKLGHGHHHEHVEHENEDEHEHEAHDPRCAHGEPIDLHEWVKAGRFSLDIPMSRNSHVLLGHSVAWDQHDNTKLFGGDLTYNYRWPNTYRKFKWQNELIYGEIRDRGEKKAGAYSLFLFTLDKHWEIGDRVDWMQRTRSDRHDQWANSIFLSYYITHSIRLTTQYRLRKMGCGDEENALYLQFVFGIGPHAHRLED